MKRLGVFLTLLLVGVVPSLGLAAWEGVSVQRNSNASYCACLEDELPWSVVDAVLKAVEDRTEYVYADLVQWYSDALLTVEEIGGGSYRVSIYAGGSQVIILVDNL